jgi:hypothetical protein
MANTIYSSFVDPSAAEKAAGALLDYGARAEDISLVRSVRELDGRVRVDPLIASSSGQDLTNKALDDPAGIGRSTATYSDTGHSETWAGEHNDYGEETERLGYTGSASAEKHEQNDTFGDQIHSLTDFEREAKEGISTTTIGDAELGAVRGLGWGAGIGVLAGLASLTVPGVGLVIGGGALATAIGGLVATAGAGAIAGAVTGYLKDQGVDEHVAARYEESVHRGGAILAVTLPTGQVDETMARHIVEKYGGGSVSQYASRGYIA